MKRPQSINRERGVALIMAMLMVLVLTTLLLAVLLVTDTEGWSTMNYRFMVQSRYAAEAGAQATINWLSSSYSPPTSFGSYNMTTYPVQYNGSPVVLSAMSGIASNYPDSTQSSNFNTALSNQSVPYPTGSGSVTYSTYATLLRMAQVSAVSWMGNGSQVMQTWQITSQGTITGKPNSVVQVIETVENTTKVIFTNGIVSASSSCTVPISESAHGTDFAPITFDGPCETYESTSNTNSCTSSYNSSKGPYTLGSGGAIGGSGGNSSATGGDISTNGFVDVTGNSSGHTIIDGNIYDSMSTTAGTSASSCTGTSSGAGYYLDGGTINGTAQSAPSITLPCPWGCSACGTTACYPPGVTPNTNTYTLSGTSCPSGMSGCSYLGTTTIYDCPQTSCSSSNKTTVNQYYLAPGTYGNLDIGSSGGSMSSSDQADVVYLQGGGTYNINSIYFTQDQQIVVQGSGSVIINITGDNLPSTPASALYNTSTGTAIPSAIYAAGQAGFNLCSNGAPGNVGVLQSANCDTGTVTGSGSSTKYSGAAGPGTSSANPISGIPADMQIVYAGTGVMRVGGSPNALVIYMPNAPFYQPGAAVGLNGSIVSSSFIDESDSPFNYDQSLQTNAIQVGPLKLVAFTWSKY